MSNSSLRVSHQNLHMYAHQSADGHNWVGCQGIADLPRPSVWITAAQLLGIVNSFQTHTQHHSTPQHGTAQQLSPDPSVMQSAVPQRIAQHTPEDLM